MLKMKLGISHYFREKVFKRKKMQQNGRTRDLEGRGAKEGGNKGWT